MPRPAPREERARVGGLRHRSGVERVERDAPRGARGGGDGSGRPRRTVEVDERGPGVAREVRRDGCDSGVVRRDHVGEGRGVGGADEGEESRVESGAPEEVEKGRLVEGERRGSEAVLARVDRENAPGAQWPGG